MTSNSHTAKPSKTGRRKQDGIYITLVRHGQTVANHQRRTQGQQHGSLTIKGRRQAQSLGQKIKGRHFDVIYCSDLNRTRETCFEILSARKRNMNDVIMEDLLREKAAGELEGHPLGEAERLSEELAIPFRQYTPKGGESWSDVFDRAGLFLEKIWNEHSVRKVPNHKPHILAVTHGGFIKEFINFTQNLREPGLAKNNAQNTAIFTFDVRCLEDIRLIVKNECDHIRPGFLKLRDVPNVHEPASGQEDVTRAPPRLYNSNHSQGTDPNKEYLESLHPVLGTP